MIHIKWYMLMNRASHYMDHTSYQQIDISKKKTNLPKTFFSTSIVCLQVVDIIEVNHLHMSIKHGMSKNVECNLMKNFAFKHYSVAMLRVILTSSQHYFNVISWKTLHLVAMLRVILTSCPHPCSCHLAICSACWPHLTQLGTWWPLGDVAATLKCGIKHVEADIFAADIFAADISYAFSWMKVYEFR